VTEDAHRELEDVAEALVVAMTEAVQILDGKSRRYLRTQKVVKSLLEAALAKYRDIYGEAVAL
jgi:hypothetical protein